ncbi:MAG: hypothetical protein A2147_02640 [Chloroflexi bacterium RBG_16_57_8]|nr:MAG: hypothetical protein A2147_02640 [Chloroflexi bacterium RBG_16_57_8]
MCHLILLLPVLSLPLFWVLPLGYALPVNVAVALISAFAYWVVMKAMRLPARDGFHSLVGSEAEVLKELPRDHAARYLVRTHGELWSAYARDAFQRGDRVKITGVRGIGVVVERAAGRSPG